MTLALTGVLHGVASDLHEVKRIHPLVLLDEALNLINHGLGALAVHILGIAIQ